jgi:hypothetical protein
MASPTWEAVPDRTVSRKVSGPPARPIPSTRRDPTEEEVRAVAYNKWQTAGCPAGEWVRCWLAAEFELKGHSP